MCRSELLYQEGASVRASINETMIFNNFLEIIIFELIESVAQSNTCCFIDMRGICAVVGRLGLGLLVHIRRVDDGLDWSQGPYM